MFESILVNEMTSFLELRKANVGPQTFAFDAAALTALDLYLVNHDYQKKNLSEKILDAWMGTLRGKSKTVKEKVIAIRNFVKYLNGMGNHSFLPDALSSITLTIWT